MKKTIAILTKKGRLSKDLQCNSDMSIFNVQDDRVVGYENLKIEHNEYAYFISLIKKKNINLLYMDSINEELKNMLKNVGVYTKCRNECADDIFIKHFLFD